MIHKLFIFYFAPSLLSTVRINMEPVNLGYSTKNVPIAPPKEYLKCLVDKTESFLRRVRWKAYCYLNPCDPTNKQTFGFNTTKSPPVVKELEDFEGKMFSMIQNVRFNKTYNEFQKKISHDMQKIKSSDKRMIPADKTTNFYELDTPSYNNLLNTAITKAYKKAPPNITAQIIAEEKKIAKNLDLDDRIDSLATKDSFITLKDHKPNFNNNPTCRLINPSKSEIGIISKQILQRINAAVLEHVNVNQWKNTDSVISWFSNLPNKSTRSFINFDIVDFYPSISEELLCEALTFASNYVPITDNEKNIIIQAKSSVLFSQNKTWCKKTSSSLFDVTMGSFDGAETCELVGLYLLSKLPPEYSTDVGLYRDDGLAALDKSPKEIENIKKHICKIFNDHNLKLTIEANKKCVNFLDITLDLRSASYKPYT